ncbi:MAG: hypothetical protein DMG58_00805 [Acidobacteria bacterium]|nr:MAG: hypothetical protein DMG58_00805 [Acidobacteriota bacterium]
MTSNLEERCDRITRLGVADIPMEDAPAVAGTKRWGPLSILNSVDRDTERTQTAEYPQCPVMMGAEDEYRSRCVGDLHGFTL